jgi:hypothetical protein
LDFLWAAPIFGVASMILFPTFKGSAGRIMMDHYLIKNTTREEREKIIRDSLGCGGGGCENCSSCGVYGAGDPFDMYQPYIDGLKEIADINREFTARYFR